MFEKRIKNFNDYSVDTEGNVFSYKKGQKRKMSLYKEKTGYQTVWLCKDGKIIKFSVHRLIAETFIPNPENKPTVNHKNSVRDDNKVSNLEWATYSENNRHAFDFGNNKIRYGEDTSTATISNKIARSIYLDLLDGMRNKQVSDKYGVSQEIVANIKTRKYYQKSYEDLPVMEIRKRSEKFSDTTVKWICSNLEKKVPHKQILEMSTNKALKLHHIKDISRRVSYKHISKYYNW